MATDFPVLSDAELDVLLRDRSVEEIAQGDVITEANSRAIKEALQTRCQFGRINNSGSYELPTSGWNTVPRIDQYLPPGINGDIWEQPVRFPQSAWDFVEGPSGTDDTWLEIPVEASWFINYRIALATPPANPIRLAFFYDSAGLGNAGDVVQLDLTEAWIISADGRTGASAFASYNLGLPSSSPQRSRIALGINGTAGEVIQATDLICTIERRL